MSNRGDVVRRSRKIDERQTKIKAKERKGEKDGE